MVPLGWYLMLSSVLFTLGVIGVLCRRNMAVVLMSLQLMAGAVVLALVAFSSLAPRSATVVGTPDAASGQLLALMVMIVAVVQLAVGLSVMGAVSRGEEPVLVDHLDLMRE